MTGEDVAGGKRTAADPGAWLVFEDQSGQGLKPPKGRAWGRRGQTPVVTVTGGSNKRVSLAALIAVKPGQRPQLIYRVHTRRRGREAQGLHRKGVRPAARHCPRPAEPGRAGLVSPEKISGQPGQTQHQRADRAGEDPAAADAAQARPPRGLPRPTRLDLTPFCNPQN